mmetsp:Transcript_56494/g.129738  ORF Transcript_56494/g.129738 Transcript_56494/m.129738 type:complete len:200 (+) Transcript_56494:743-1342(+)
MPPRAQDNKSERQLLHDSGVKEQIADASVLMGPERLHRAREMSSAKVDRDRRAGESAQQVGRERLQRAVGEREGPDGVGAAPLWLPLGHQLAQRPGGASPRRPVISAAAARAVGLGVQRRPRAPRHHAVVVVRAAELAHEREVDLEPRQVRERVVVRLDVPLGVEACIRIEPPSERLLCHRVWQVVTCLHGGSGGGVYC